jgi:large subunit ribosomal protein L25
MAETVVLKTQPRQERGTRASRHLRAEGRIPAVVYGHKEEAASVTVAADELEKVVRSGAHLVELDAGGARQKVLLRDLQFDHLGKDLLHVDFFRVSDQDRVQVHVKLELRGTAPGATGGGVLDQPLHTLLVECPVIAVPHSIRVNIDKLMVGQAIHVKELQLPEGVKALADDDQVVVSVKLPGAEPAPAAGPAAAAESAEPEVITRGKEKEEGEE